MTQAAVEHGAASGAAVLTVHKALGLAEGGARAARTVTTAQDPPTILRVRSSIALMVALTSMACRGMPLPLSGTIHPYGLWDEPRSSPRGRNDTRPRGMRRTDSVCYERTPDREYQGVRVLMDLNRMVSARRSKTCFMY